MITIRDVAKLAGVATSTASMALNGKKRVSQETRAKVLRAAEKLEYIPNSIAKSLTVQKTGVVGLLLAEIVNPYHASLTHFIERELRKNGFRMNLGISEGNIRLEEGVIKDFISQKVDGVLIHTADIVNFSTSCLFELIKRNIPIVLLGGGFDEVSLSRVDIDLEQASYELTHYLLGRGYHRFLYLSGLKEASTFKRRIVGFQKAMAEAGYSVVDDQIIETHPDIDGGYEETRRIFSEKRNASEVVLCVNDFMAFGVLKAMKELQLRVPEDVGVVGFDDISFASMAGVPITTVHIPVDELAQKGINMLCRQIEGQASGMSNAVQVEFVPTHLIVRNSTA